MFGRRKTVAVDKRIQKYYRRYAELAARFGFVFTRCRLSTGGRPNVLLLGNHSSGKSTWINFLLNDIPIQDTGVAPIDDGFTVIQFGESDVDSLGPAALRALTEDFAALERLGPNFLRRFKVKQRPCELLKSINLIDSPGMIDAARGEIRRDYDFMAAVRRMAELSDLVLFLFDPDKPGTTAESLMSIRDALPGMHYKLRFLLNKADTFENMHDFARAYGALCWNLARVLPTKDLPIVHTTYVPSAHADRRPRLDMADFDRRRESLLAEIRQAGERRVDNIVALMRQDLTRLALHVRVCLRVRRVLLGLRLRHLLLGLATALGVGGAGMLGAHLAGAADWGRLLVGGLAGVLAAWGAWQLAASDYARRRAELLRPESLDNVMETVYRHELATELRDDLRQGWQEVREQTQRVLDRLAERLPLHDTGLSRLEQGLKKDT